MKTNNFREKIIEWRLLICLEDGLKGNDTSFILVFIVNEKKYRLWEKGGTIIVLIFFFIKFLLDNISSEQVNTKYK